MKTRCYFTNMTVALVSAVLATLFLIACQQSQQPSAPAAVESKAASTEKVFVEFQGPWAFVPDPKDANILLAIAPKSKGHRDLFVQASNQSKLDSGVYELSLPAHSGPAAATADPNIAQAKVDAQSLQRALDKKSARYVIRLPKPEEYVIAERHRSRLGAIYPPDASTEKDYATAVSLRYNVSSLNGFSLAGTPDSGAFNPLLLQVETPTIHFIIMPAQFDDPNDKCDTHSREAFHDLTTLFGLTLYVDFPDNPADCHSKDPQSAHPAKADAGSRLERLVALLTENLSDEVQGESAAGDARSYLTAAIYFFGIPSGDCMGPPLILTIAPTPPTP
jgi:hypothetical protein